MVQAIAGDLHAGAVAAALRLIGIETLFSIGTDVPDGQAMSVHIDRDGDTRLIRRDDARVALDGSIDLVWSRRAQMFRLPDLDPEDVAFAEREFGLFLDGYWEQAAPAAVWINPWAARKLSNTKLNQLAIARTAGFAIAATLFSHDPEEIADFVGRHGAGKVVFKTISPGWWRDADGRLMSTPTSIVGAAMPEDRAALALCPGIYQALIDKAAEYRVTVMDDHVYCAELLAGALPGATVDWRIGQHELKVRAHRLPPEIEEKCRALLRGHGLRFGCIDLILGADGDYYFLEVNEMGQFLWIERLLPEERYLERFVRFLVGALSEELHAEFALAAILAGPAYRALMATTLATRDRRGGRDQPVPPAWAVNPPSPSAPADRERNRPGRRRP